MSQEGGIPLDEPREREGASPAGDPSVVFLESALWKQLNEAATGEDIAASWLALQCRVVAGALSGLLLLTRPGAAPEIAARWPGTEEHDSRLRSAALIAVKEGRGVVQAAGPDRGQAERIVAYPALVDGAAEGAVAILIGAGGGDLRAAMRQVQWGVAWVRDWLRRSAAERREGSGRQSKAALDLIASVLEAERFKPAAVAAVTELALLGAADRASIGFRRRGSSVVAAISHSAQFGHKMDLVRLLGAAMDEAIDQQSVVQASLAQPSIAQGSLAQPSGEPLATRAHVELARAGNGHALTIPILVRDHFAAALTLERPAERPFKPAEIDLLATVAAAIGPILEDKRRNDRWIGAKIADAAASGLRRVFGPGHLGLKLGLAAALLAALALSFATGDYQVSATARIEGSIRRAVVAPTDGFIKEASARAGDTVKEGGLLAALEDRDLTLERLRWVTERSQRELEYQGALAARERAKINIVRSQIDQAEAQIKLIDEQIARARLQAPFDALVVSGDLTQSIGAAVSRGQVLFELAPLDSYRVNMAVDESQIADLVPGQRGTVLVSSLPDEPFALVVRKITPVAETLNGRNVFRVEAELEGLSPRLRPGMEGVAKIEIERRSLVWIWTRTLLNWLRLTSWQWLP